VSGPVDDRDRRTTWVPPLQHVLEELAQNHVDAHFAMEERIPPTDPEATYHLEAALAALRLTRAIGGSGGS